MSSLRHVQRCIANTKAYAGLNAFIRLADHNTLEAAAQSVDTGGGPGGESMRLNLISRS